MADSCATASPSKVDVEGWEWEVLDSWLSTWDVLPFTQLQVILSPITDPISSSCELVLGHGCVHGQTKGMSKYASWSWHVSALIR